MSLHAILFSGIFLGDLPKNGFYMKGHVLSTETNLTFQFFSSSWDESYKETKFCFISRNHKKIYISPILFYRNNSKFLLFIDNLTDSFGATYLKFVGRYSKDVVNRSLVGYMV